MNTDMIKLITQYGQLGNISSTVGSTQNANKGDFNSTLNNILAGKSTVNVTSLEDLYKAASTTKSNITTNSELEAIFQKAADTYDVPVELLKAVGKAESNFNPDAVSHCGAMGIMQLMPATAKSLGVTDAFDPEQNIMGGAKYLSDKLKAYDGDITLALAAYNAGPGNVAKYGGVPPFKETQNYIKKIYGYMGEDIQLPDSITASRASSSSLLGVNNSQDASSYTRFSEMGSEKAYYQAQLQIIKQQLDMQHIFFDYDNEDEDNNDSNSLDIEALINQLNNL